MRDTEPCTCEICEEFGQGMCAKIGDRQVRAPTQVARHPDFRPYHPLRVKNPMDSTLQETFLDTLEATGLLRISADAIGVDATEVQNYRRDNPEFELLVQDAIARHAENTVARIQKITLEGVREPIVGGKNRDQIVAYKTRYPERLLETFLVRYDPSFNSRQKIEVEHSGSSLRSDFPFHTMSKRARKAFRAFLVILAEEQEAQLESGESDGGDAEGGE